MPEIRELESFEDFEDAIHNGPTKDCFNAIICEHAQAYKRYGILYTVVARLGSNIIEMKKVQDSDALYTGMWDL